ncbi:MAG: hypothetical protein F6K62_12585, partial [Sphaerospermopsis sp. SIO1G2]|nr:hypothetical protein [Sphaerospermopsis sp. SIO1G2]
MTIAGTCASQCGPRPLEFKPGQYLRLKIVNHTPRVVQMEKFPEMRRMFLHPGKEYTMDQANATVPNFSIIFWDDTGRS